MSLEHLFEKLDSKSWMRSTGSQLIDVLDSFKVSFAVQSDYDAGALCVSVDTATWSAR